MSRQGTRKGTRAGGPPGPRPSLSQLDEGAWLAVSRRSLDVYDVGLCECPKWLAKQQPQLGTSEVLLARGMTKDQLPRIRRRYDAWVEAERVLTEATAVDVDNREAVRTFVGNWGLLGRNPHWQSLSEAQMVLRRIQLIAHGVRAALAGAWTDPVFGTRSARPKLQRQAMRREISLELWRASYDQPIRPFLEATDAGFLPRLVPASLTGALYLELWKAAGDPGHELRSCEFCGGLFRVSATNQVKRFCKKAHKHLAEVRRHRAAQKRRTV